MARLNYVQNDQRPALRISLEAGSLPIDVSAVGVSVNAYVRLAGQSALKATLAGVKSTGRRTAVNADTGEWTVSVAAPYNVAGVGGIVLFNPTAACFDTAGQYEIEYEIDWGAGVKQTIYQKDQVNVRAQVG